MGMPSINIDVLKGYILALIKQESDTACIDIGTRYIKYAVLNSSVVKPDEIVLKKWGIIPTPQDIFSVTFTDNPILDKAQFTDTMKKMANKNSLKNQDIILLLFDSLVLVNWLNVKLQPNEEVPKVVDERLTTLLPSEINNWYIDHQVLEEKKTGSVILTEAILKENLLQFGGVLQEAGMNPVTIDVSSFNMINAFHKYLMLPDNHKKNISLINMGHESTTVMIFREGILKIMRNVPFGGKDFSKNLMEAKDCSFEEAEKIKAEQEIFLSENFENQNKVDEYNMIKPSFGEIIKGIYNSFDHYLAKFREFKIHEIIMAGGCSNLSNMNLIIQKHLNIPIKMGSDLLQISGPKGPLEPEDVNMLIPSIGGLMRN